MTIPATMRHIAVSEPGPPEVMKVAQGPVPQPRADEVLIEVAYAGVNRPDCLQRAGAYPPPPDASPILGLEVAGRVVACGAEAEGFGVGDDVCALTPGGGYAEFCTAPAAWCLPIPRGLSLAQAASLPETCFRPIRQSAWPQTTRKGAPVVSRPRYARRTRPCRKRLH
jgi:NADPH:quinone reductase-like Zn-dependent oxidoreductase